jgi:hypothetical protein
MIRAGIEGLVPLSAWIFAVADVSANWALRAFEGGWDHFMAKPLSYIGPCGHQPRLGVPLAAAGWWSAAGRGARGARGKARRPGARLQPDRLRADQALWFEALTHATENIGQTETHDVTIELREPERYVLRSTLTVPGWSGCASHDRGRRKPQ